MTSRLVAVALDCHDPEALAAFWCAALGYRVRERWSDAGGTGYVETGDSDGAVLLFQPVHEDKAVKNRLHLDIAPVQGDVDTADAAITADRAEQWRQAGALGARYVELRSAQLIIVDGALNPATLNPAAMSRDLGPLVTDYGYVKDADMHDSKRRHRPLHTACRPAAHDHPRPAGPHHQAVVHR